MKIGLVTDTHFGIRNDNVNFLDYFEKFYSKHFFPHLKEQGIDTIIHLGDIVDRRKYINYVTLRRMKEMFIDKCTEEGIELHVIVGNHDVPYKNTNDVNSMRELFDKGNVNYYAEPTDLKFDGHDIHIMPWINNQNYAAAIQAMEDTPAQVLFGHLEIAGCLMDRGNMNEHGMKISDFTKFELVCSGHFHHKSTTKNIEYLGCPYELTWADYGDTKGFHIYDTDTRNLEFVRNPYSMFHKLFYNESGKTMDEILNVDFEGFRNTYVKVIKQKCDNPYWFDMYIDKLYKVDPLNIQIVDDHMNLDLEDDEDIVNEAEDTMTILSKYVGGLPDNVPKQRLDFLLRSLYNESLTIE
jgi:DNA repair exonuclease SbcCD nuclease subunit